MDGECTGCDWTSFELVLAFQDQEKLLSFLFAHRLLTRTAVCRHCDSEVPLNLKTLQFRCNKRRKSKKSNGIQKPRCGFKKSALKDFAVKVSVVIMPHTHRSVAFSGKKKKEQIKARKDKKLLIQMGKEPERQRGNRYRESQLSEATAGTLRHDESSETKGIVDYLKDIQTINQQPGARRNANRYNLKFRKETPEEAEKRKAFHYVGIDMVSEYELENTSDAFFPDGLSYPNRPPWKKNMSKDDLDRSENKFFRLFCEDLDRQFAGADLSLYELNLETWRQLWRVTEMSDILLIIVDARFSVAQFPPYLYQHLIEKENKGIILILNKCDLLPPAVVVAWEEYFHTKFPKLLVVPFSSLEGYGHKRGLLKMAAESSLRLVDACQKLVDDSVDLDPWRNKIEEERKLGGDSDVECQATQGVTVMEQSTRPEIHQRFKDGILTVGTIGHPNVGKSSLINALMGRKVVSVSRTPGHTKHFQTIFLTKNVKLCDCPGLVFPSTVSIPLQVLLGSYPISQVRDPVGVVHYIASRLDIPNLLNLDYKVTGEELEGFQWTAFYICEAWAIKRGYRTRARGTPDVARAANELLRLCLNGHKSLVLFFRPPEFCKNKEMFEFHPRIQEIIQIQGVHAKGLELLSQDKKDGEEDKQVSEIESTESEGEEESESSEESETEDLEVLRKDSVKNRFALLTEDD